jgi:hypothetical protein
MNKLFNKLYLHFGIGINFVFDVFFRFTYENSSLKVSPDKANE